MVQSNGGELHMRTRVTELRVEGNKISEVVAVDAEGKTHVFPADYVVSTMPIQHLIRSLQCPIPAEVKEVSEGLIYRDFITVGLLVNKLLVTEPDGSPLKDTWIYIQEPDVTVGRLQIFNNWSPWMVADRSTRCGLAWNISATIPTRYGRCRTRTSRNLRSRRWRRSEF